MQCGDCCYLYQISLKQSVTANHFVRRVSGELLKDLEGLEGLEGRAPGPQGTTLQTLQTLQVRVFRGVRGQLQKYNSVLHLFFHAYMLKIKRMMP